MLQTSLTSAMCALEFDWRSSVEAWRPSPSQKWKGQQASCHLKEEKKSSWGKAKSWKGFLTPSACQEKLVGQSKKLKRLPHTLCMPKRWFPPRGRAQITWSRYFRRNTSILYQQTANCWKCYKTTRTGKQKPQPQHPGYMIQGTPNTGRAKDTDLHSSEHHLSICHQDKCFHRLVSRRCSEEWWRQTLLEAQTPNQQERLQANTVFLTDWHHAESLVTRRGADLHRHQTVPTQHKDVNDPTVDSFPLWYKRQWGSPAIKRSSKQEQSAHLMSCSEVKAVLNSVFRTLWRHLNKLA